MEEALNRNDEEDLPENLANLSEQSPDRLKNLSLKLVFWRKRQQ